VTTFERALEKYREALRYALKWKQLTRSGSETNDLVELSRLQAGATVSTDLEAVVPILAKSVRFELAKDVNPCRFSRHLVGT
jgi:hypothetical protein